MASHHHHDGGCHRLHHHNHRESIPHIPPPYYATSSPCFCADSSPCCTQPSPPNLDHLLRLIASYLQNQQKTQCSCETPSPTLNVVKRQSLVNQQQQHQQKKKNVQREYDNLLRKIDDLDVSLSRFSARRGSYSTLKDSAARVIQTHFRSYLVRRSVSLRQLKELASIKSSFLSLKSSVCGKTHFPFEAVSREATNLLLQLDSIQGRVDSMIRDGKRALCRDLVRFLHYVDDCAVKRRNLVSKSVKDVSFRVKRHVGEDGSTEKSRKQIRRVYVRSSGDEEDIAELEEFHFMSEDGQETPIVSVEKSRKIGASKSRVEDNKVKTPAVPKTVKIGKNRNVYELTSSAEDDDSFDGGEEIMMMSRGDGVGSNSRSRSRSGVVINGSGGKTKVVKNVSFDENGNVYKVYGDTPEASVSEGDESSTSGSNNENRDGYNEVEDIKYVPKENEEDEEEEEAAHSEDEEESSSQSSKEEAQVIGKVSHKETDEHKREVQLRKVTSMFSPPLPLKMEL